jgi:hypothetical protein
MGPITILNLIKYFPGIAHTARNLAFDVTNDTLIIHKTARELLFGYEDRLLEVLKNLVDSIFKDLIPSIEIGYFTGVSFFFFANTSLIVPKSNPCHLSKQKNGTVAGHFTVFTGVDDYKKVGVVERYNYKEYALNFFLPCQF